MPSVRIEVFCDDPDAFISRALAAGATAGRHRIQVHATPWGPHRQGGFVDPFGHIWFVGDRSPLARHPGLAHSLHAACCGSGRGGADYDDDQRVAGVYPSPDGPWRPCGPLQPPRDVRLSPRSRLEIHTGSHDPHRTSWLAGGVITTRSVPYRTDRLHRQRDDAQPYRDTGFAAICWRWVAKR